VYLSTQGQVFGIVKLHISARAPTLRLGRDRLFAKHYALVPSRQGKALNRPGGGTSFVLVLCLLVRHSGRATIDVVAGDA
jgi:hypothetical protein